MIHDGVKPAVVLVEHFFATDRDLIPKGDVEVFR